jgi:hypothetical protein
LAAKPTSQSVLPANPRMTRTIKPVGLRLLFQS